MIYTCTMNPAVDYKLVVNDFKRGELNRSVSAIFGAGGKGINVSTVLTNLKVSNKAIGFFGGFTGSYIEESLKQRKIKYDFIKTKESTRLNVKIRQNKNGLETEINQEGPLVSSKEFNQLLSRINKLSKDDMLICGGRSARGIVDGYVKIAKICNKNKVPFIMDISSSEMLTILKFKPLLIKPNKNELAEFFKTKLTSVNQVIKYGKKLINLGAQNVLVSLGKDGSVLITKHKIYQAQPIVGKVISTVGAGDSMVAGFVQSFNKDRDHYQAYKYAVAAATSTAFSQTLADINGIKKYLPKVVIKELKL